MSFRLKAALMIGASVGSGLSALAILWAVSTLLGKTYESGLAGGVLLAWMCDVWRRVLARIK